MLVCVCVCVRPITHHHHQRPPQPVCCCYSPFSPFSLSHSLDCYANQIKLLLSLFLSPSQPPTNHHLSAIITGRSVSLCLPLDRLSFSPPFTHTHTHMNTLRHCRRIRSCGRVLAHLICLIFHNRSLSLSLSRQQSLSTLDSR